MNENGKKNTTDKDTVEWFSSINKSAPVDNSIVERKRSPIMLLIGFATITVFIGIIASAVLYYAFLQTNSVQGGMCIDTNTYEDLTGVTMNKDDVAKKNTYEFIVDFERDSNEFSYLTEKSTEEFLNKIGVFYKKYSENVMIKIDIIPYSGEIANGLPEQLKTSITELGVSEAAVKIKALETDRAEEVDNPATRQLIVRLTTLSTCE